MSTVRHGGCKNMRQTMLRIYPRCRARACVSSRRSFKLVCCVRCAVVALVGVVDGCLGIVAGAGLLVLRAVVAYIWWL